MRPTGLVLMRLAGIMHSVYAVSGTLKTGYLNKALPVILGQSCLLSVGGYGYFHLFILSCNCIVFAACVVLVVVT